MILRREQRLHWPVEWMTSQGFLSDVLKVVAEFGANILTIHQTIPINGIASLSLSIQILDVTSDVSAMVTKMEQRKRSAQC